MKEDEAIRQAMERNPEFTKVLQDLLGAGTIKAGLPEDAKEIVVIAADTPAGVDGSKQMRCEYCTAICWIAPSSQAMMARTTAKVHIACLTCFIGMRGKE